MTRHRQSALLLVTMVLVLQPVFTSAAEDQPAKGNAVIYQSPEFQQRLKRANNYRVAVMPIDNLSLEPDAPDILRERIIDRLVSAGFTVVKIRTVDRVLRKLGVTHAGQLSYLSIEQLSQLIPADAFLYGMVEQAATQNAVVFNAYAYTGSLQLHDTEGVILWSAQQERVAKRRIALDPINALIDPLLVKEGGDQRQAIMALADRLLKSFPKGPVKVIHGDPLLDRAIEIPVNQE